MRLLSLNILKSSNLKFWNYEFVKLRRKSYAAIESIPQDSEKLVEMCSTWPEDEEPEMRAELLRDVMVTPNFVSENEEMMLMKELEPILKRMRYEMDHWDDAIQEYRETERIQWGEENTIVARRLRETAQQAGGGDMLPHLHVLDLASSGHIRPHVDSVRYCGDVIAGVCLLSAAVMRLAHEHRPHLAVNALLPRRGLYIIRGIARYSFTHAVLVGGDSAFGGRPVQKGRRISVIARSEPRPEHRGA